MQSRKILRFFLVVTAFGCTMCIIFKNILWGNNCFMNHWIDLSFFSPEHLLCLRQPIKTVFSATLSPVDLINFCQWGFDDFHLVLSLILNYWDFRSITCSLNMDLIFQIWPFLPHEFFRVLQWFKPPPAMDHCSQAYNSSC